MSLTDVKVFDALSYCLRPHLNSINSTKLHLSVKKVYFNQTFFRHLSMNDHNENKSNMLN